MRNLSYQQILADLNPSALLKKVSICMRIVSMMLFLSTEIIYANSYAEQTSLSLKLKNATITQVLESIEKQTEFHFYYNNSLIDSEKKVSIDMMDVDVFAVLDKLFANTNVNYKVINKDIILTVKKMVGSSSNQASSRIIKGIVTDKHGEPLIGVSISVKGEANKGTITGIDGDYELSGILVGTSLIFSYVGMEPKEVTVGKENVINIILDDAAFNLDEVVALGYTTQKRKDMIGSVAKISADISTPAYSNITGALQGKASGVFVSNDKIRIRGVNSISLDTEPLWIIDGIPGNGSDLNPNDIESVTILKDASATALYGSSGVNGVIAITTKSYAGQKSALNIEVDGGFSNLMGTGYKMMDSRGFIELYDMAIQNDSKYTGNAPYEWDPNMAFNGNPKIPADRYSMTREQAMANSHGGINDYTQTGKYYQIHMTATKGFDKGNAMLSVTYRNTESTQIGPHYDKLLMRTSLNFSPVKFLNINFNSIDHFYNNRTNAAGSILTRTPFMPIYDSTSPTGYWAPGENPIIRGNDDYRETRSKGISSTNYLKVTLDIPFVPGLTISGIGSANFDASRYTDWYHKELLDFNNQSVSKADDNANFAYSFLARGEINYNRTFGDHAIGVLALAEGRRNHSAPVNASGYNLNGSYHILGTPGNMMSMNSLRTEGGSMAYIGRVTYKYKEKYLFEGNIRRDGLSSLSTNHRWSTFPSIGLGWVLSEESFFKIPFISLLKLRGSWGKTGNAAVPAFVYLPTFSVMSPSGSTYEEYMFTAFNNLASDVKWETSDNTDVGIDFGFLNNRINGSVAYYNKETSGLLLQVPLPPSAGIKIEATQNNVSNSIWNNVGNMRNNGVEFNISANAITTKDFSWDIAYNHTWMANKVLALDPSVDLTGSGVFGSNSTLTKAGGELATYYLADFAGIDPEKGIPLIWERDPVVFAETGETVRTGKKVPASASNVGNNQFYLEGKSTLPSFYGGLRNSFRYKDFDLSFLITYSGGNYFLDYIDWRSHYLHTGENALAVDLLERSWKKPGDIADFPELLMNGGFYYDNEGNASDVMNPPANNDNPTTTQYLKNGSNIQLKELTLGYKLPKRLVAKVGMENVRLYFNMTNVLYWAKAGHNGNPEIGVNGGSNINGILRYDSFLPRTCSFGVSVKF